MSTARQPATEPVLLYDGTCGVCARTVQFVLRHERGRRTLRFASLQGPTGREVRARHPEVASADSVMWYAPATDRTPERVLVRSGAVLAVGAYLGGVWRVLAWLGRLVPRVVRDAAYDLVARNRFRIAAAACLLPTPEERLRFLDTGG